MKAAYCYNKRGTVHDWRESGESGYYLRGCDQKMTHFNNLQTSQRDIEGLPECKRCFPLNGREK